MYNIMCVGVEKRNDLCHSFYQSSNRHNIPRTLLQTGIRMDLLSNHKREPSQYSKHSMNYWMNLKRPATLVLCTDTFMSSH